MDDGSFLCFALMMNVVFGVIGLFVGKSKGNETSGFVWGLLLGPLGLLITALLPDRRPENQQTGLSGDWPPPAPASPASTRARIEREEREAVDTRRRIEAEERMRLEIRARLEAEARGEAPPAKPESSPISRKVPPPGGA